MRRSRVTGGSKLRRKLQRMEKQDSEVTRGLKKAIERSAAVVYADTLANVPVDEGDLAASLHKAKRSSGFAWWVGWWKKGNLKNYRRAGWRAKFTEFGTKGSGNIPPQPARPSLGPAYRRSEKWIVGHIKAAVNRALRKAGDL